MARQVSLTRAPQKAQDQSYRYTMTAAGTEMPGEIFVINKRPLDPTRGTATGAFDHVATPRELTDLPVNAPLAGSSLYRVNTVILTYDTRAEADLAWAVFKSEVDALVRALNSGDASLAPETVVLDG